jgi:hypothetical protein
MLKEVVQIAGQGSKTLHLQILAAVFLDQDIIHPGKFSSKVLNG